MVSVKSSSPVKTPVYNVVTCVHACSYCWQVTTVLCVAFSFGQIVNARYADGGTYYCAVRNNIQGFEGVVSDDSQVVVTGELGMRCSALI